MEKKFLLGVGAQKAGTSWLHHYLSGHSVAVNMGVLKEYHVFDVLYLKDPRITKKFLQHRINQVLEGDCENASPSAVVLGFIGDVEKYFDYFSGLLKTKDVMLTGDITPSYAGLPISALTLIRERLIARGIRPRVVFIMRDPVERCISAARFELRMDGTPRTQESELAALNERYKTDEYSYRTRYDLTLKNMDTVFEPEEVLVLFYEELFRDEAIRNLCDFLGLPFRVADYSRMVNESRTESLISNELRRDIAIFYEKVYRDVMERYGVERVRSLWKSSYLVS